MLANKHIVEIAFFLSSSLFLSSSICFRFLCFRFFFGLVLSYCHIAQLLTIEVLIKLMFAHRLPSIKLISAYFFPPSPTFHAIDSFLSTSLAALCNLQFISCLARAIIIYMHPHTAHNHTPPFPCRRATKPWVFGVMVLLSKLLSLIEKKQSIANRCNGSNDSHPLNERTAIYVHVRCFSSDCNLAPFIVVAVRFQPVLHVFNNV